MKNRQIRKLTAMILTAAMLISMFMIPTVPAKSASKGITTLKTDTVYTNLDVTGDGKKDRFKLQKPKVTGRPAYSYLSITVNGKEAIRINRFYEFDATAKLLSLSNGKKFLFVSGLADGVVSGTGGFTCLLQYKNGKFIKVIDFNQIFKPHAQYWAVSVSSVQGNSIKFIINAISLGQGYLTGEYLMQYDYQGGKLVHLSANDRLIKYNDDTRTAIVGKSCAAYSNTSRTNKLYTLPKGAKVRVDQCRISSTRVLCRIKYGTRYGWVVASEAFLNVRH